MQGWNNEIAGHFCKPPLNSLIRGKIKQDPFPELNLSNGTNVYGRGTNSPEFIRGKKIHLALLDEAAFFKDGVIRIVTIGHQTILHKRGSFR